jgi:hypothetical protein
MGMGTYFDKTQASHSASYEKAGYGSQFLYVLTIALGKVATFLFALKLDAKRHLPRLTYAGIIATGLWFL